MKLFGQTDIGKMRDSNEDVFVFQQLASNMAYGLVCDGMGGVNGGNIASQMARDVIAGHLTKELKPDMPQDLIQAIMMNAMILANGEVYHKAMEDEKLNGMGTTAVLAVLANETIYTVHVGDSRAYLYHDNVLTRLTTDHSFVQILLEQGKITSKQAESHPQRNRITRAVGAQSEIEPEFHTFCFSAGDVLLLCTDGLTNSCSEEQIQEIIANNPPRELPALLIAAANENGGQDNITVLVAVNK